MKKSEYPPPPKWETHDLSPPGVAEAIPFNGGMNYVTDGPFFYRSCTGDLFMIWSSFIKRRYVELVVKFVDGKLGTKFEHLAPLFTEDGGHGMIFEVDRRLYLTFHAPNTPGAEHPCFIEIADSGNILEVK